MSSRTNTPAKLMLAVGCGTIAICAGTLLLVAGWAMRFTASAQETCTPPQTGTLSAGQVPAELVAIFEQAAAHYQLGPGGPAILAALTMVESDFGRDLSTSSAGAVGWTQFLPATWKQYGVDANGDGSADPNNPTDAIYAAANYLHVSGAPGNWPAALYTYNHAGWYVDKVLHTASQLTSTSGQPSAASLPTSGCAAITVPELGGQVQRVTGGGQIVPVPGQPGISIDERILPDLLWITHTFHARVTAGYAPTGHAPGGEHPLGLAVDLVPGPGGSWDDIDRLAALAEPIQNQPHSPWRWVGYNGDPGHGRGNHLHLSWQHGPSQPGNTPPAAWVLVLATQPSG